MSHLLTIHCILVSPLLHRTARTMPMPFLPLFLPCWRRNTKEEGQWLLKFGGSRRGCYSDACHLSPFPLFYASFNSGFCPVSLWLYWPMHVCPYPPWPQRESAHMSVAPYAA
ncbi:hypothetical protein J3F83DRAFT_753440 [Trichoderma novae-zelandiae]